ncbi:MAG: SpoIID/LytB domain-containing protein, partial [Odoribacter sp.]|nr:SpoIID/LytB domain-containing protein [Odoribacter sp.]
VDMPFTFIPIEEQETKFELLDVTIGIQFHWERKENQTFKGCLQFIKEDNLITAVNIIDIEDYLVSVISSEMSATSSLELLKAHAVISRSWLLAQQEKSKEIKSESQNYQSFIQNEKEFFGWYDREDHSHYDVCADDHCQRYQGIQKISTELVNQAVNDTKGEVLESNGKICDTRFSKCCGGMTEKFENVWEPVSHEYLQGIYDAEPDNKMNVNLTQEKNAEEWIKYNPDVFCNTMDKKILSDVLNDYDLETQDFFHWEVFYTQDDISNLVKEKLSIDFGLITDINPIERGVSGRIIKLEIIGTERSMIIGKELVIRKAFSSSHLYSSAFTVHKEIMDGNLVGFRFKGAGWGHGVGLCQIGAAVMASRGYSYEEILYHYFPNTVISKNIKTAR